VFVPQHHEIGAQAEADFYEADLDFPWGRQTAQIIVVRSEFSAGARHAAYPTQNQAAFLEGIELGLHFLGGAFPIVRFDYVPRNIIELLFPPALCALEAARRHPPATPGGERLGATNAGHITLREMPATSAASRRSAKPVWCGMPPKNPAAGWLQGLPAWSWC